MNKEDKIHAEKVLKNLFIGSQVDGLQFGISPGAIKIHFTNFHDSVDYDGQLYINIESKWCLFNKPPKDIHYMKMNLKIILRKKNMGEYLR